MCRVPLQFLISIKDFSRTLLEYFKVAKSGPLQRPLGSFIPVGSPILSRSCLVLVHKLDPPVYCSEEEFVLKEV